MKILVVYESMYGNTHAVAEAIAGSLEALGEVRLGSVVEVTPESAGDSGLLVVGGPTHVHGLSRATSRTAAAEAAEQDDALDMDTDPSAPGLREWFKDLPDAAAGALGAAFDTRIDKPAILTGSAAKGIATQLRRHRYRPLGDPQSFFVEDSGGPLEEGEADRARRWGSELADRSRELGLGN